MSEIPVTISGISDLLEGSGKRGDVMPNKNYQRGFSAEKRCQDDLTKEGYWNQRAYGSKGAWDVIAIGKGIVRLIEVKRSKSKIVKIDSIHHKYHEAIEKFIQMPPNCASLELWIWFDKQEIVGHKNHHTAHWEKFRITPQTFSRIPDVVK
jgi:Holliday junction resolvase